jgi:hypothetical protein
MTNTLFLRNQLEFIQNTLVKQDFPDRMIANGTLLPISREVPPGAETYSYRIFTAVGSAKIIATGAEDLPEVNAFVEKRTGFIRTIANQFHITDDELDFAQYANVNVSSEMAVAAMEVMMAELDRVGYLGDTQNQLLGLLNHPNVPSTTVLNDGTGSSTLWSSKTSAQIYRDMRNFVTSVRNSTNMVESPDTMLLPIEQFDLIAQEPFPSGTSSTILSFFLENQRKYPGGVQQVLPVPFINGQGTSGGDLAILLSRRESKIKFHIPADFRMLPEERVGLKYVYPCKMRVGGVQCNKPLSMAYLQGI